MDVHAVNAIPLTYLDTRADIGQAFIILLQDEIAMGSEIDHNLVILPFFNSLESVAEIKLRQRAQNRA